MTYKIIKFVWSQIRAMALGTDEQKEKFAKFVRRIWPNSPKPIQSNEDSKDSEDDSVATDLYVE